MHDECSVTVFAMNSNYFCCLFVALFKSMKSMKFVFQRLTFTLPKHEL